MTLIRRLYSEYTLILMVLLVGLGVSALSAWQYQKSAQAKIVAGFYDAAQDRVHLIRDKIDHNNIVLRSVVAFFRASQHVERGEFATFTGQVLRDYPYINRLEWIPRVAAADRQKFEQDSGLPGFTVREKDEHGNLVPAAARAEYFPVYYAEPQNGGASKVMGLDIATEPTRFRTLQEARENHRLAATGRVQVVQAGEGSVPGVIFYAPVVEKTTGPGGQEYERISGFVGSVVPFADMIEAALKPLNYAGMNIVIHDLSADRDEDRLLYVRSTRLKKIPDDEILGDFHNPGPLLEKDTIEVGARQWQVTILPARGYFTTQIQQGAYLIFLGGILFTALLVFYMRSRIEETQRIIHEVEQRTRELEKAKRETEMILLSTNEGIIGLDQDGRITFCNATSSQILGYSKKDLIGQPHHALVHNRRADGTPYDIESCPVQKILDYGQACSVRDEVFWNKAGEAVQVEYTGSPLIEGGGIVGAVLVFRDVAERRALEKKLEQLARYDQLTGLANRALFIEHLKGAIARAERGGRKVGVVYLDLNGFKPINDTLGHAAGDRLLKEFAGCLRQIVRTSDVPARMGGDEFTILADGLSGEKECLMLVERLRKCLEKPFEIAGQKFDIGASVGIAFYPDHATDFEDLISCADTAMYQAKKDKSLPYVVYTQGQGAADPDAG